MADGYTVEELPTLEEALKDRESYLNISTGIYKYQKHCRNFLLPMKVREWCEHLGCLNLKADEICVQGTLPPQFAVNLTTTTLVPLTTIPLLQNLERVGYNDTYYDAYLSDPAWLAFIQHVVLGWLSLILCIVGVLSHTLCIPTFNVASIRSGTTLYLTGIAVVDILYLILVSLLVVVRSMPLLFIDQLRMYGRFSVYLIPVGLPAMELCELLMVWFIIALLLDRYFYLKYGYQSKSICSRSLSAKVMIGIFVFLAIYTIPKFLKYEIVEDEVSGLAQLVVSNIGKDSMYENLMTHWLKVPIEMFLPYLAVCLISVIITVKMIDTHSIRQKKFNASLAAGMTPREIIEHRENATATIAICLGVFLLLAKMPKFVLHVLITEGYIFKRNLSIFELSNQFISIVFAFCKPLFCLYIGYHFKHALKAIFCCRDIPETLALEMKLLEEKPGANNPNAPPPVYANLPMEDTPYSKVVKA